MAARMDPTQVNLGTNVLNMLLVQLEETIGTRHHTMIHTHIQRVMAMIAPRVAQAIMESFERNYPDAEPEDSIIPVQVALLRSIANRGW